MMDPLISIIVPVYNVEKYLRKCLDSIIDQTYKNIEIICVNNGSQDNSYKILEVYANDDSRIKIISQDNKGVSFARNAALDIARGEYIMFVYSDDWIEKDACRASLDAMHNYNAEIVMWDYIREFENSSQPKNIFDENVVFNEEDVKKKLHRRMIGITGEQLRHPEKADALCTIWDKLYKRECIYNNDIRFYDIREIGTYEDGLFNMEVLENVQRAVYIHEYLYHYRKNNVNSLTKVYKSDLREKHENIHKYMKEYIINNKLGTEYSAALNNRIAMELVGYGLNILKLDRNRVLEIKKIILDNYYRQAYRQLEFKYFPIHWKIFYGCAKYNIAIGVYLLLLCIQRVIMK